MKPTAQQYKAILKKARQLAKEEEDINKQWKKTCGVLCEGDWSYPIELGRISSFCEGLNVVFPGIWEDIIYWVYDVPSVMKTKGKCIRKDSHGKEYDVSKLEGYVKFLIAGDNDGK